MGRITTIKLEKNTKFELDHLKFKSETYNAIIKRLISKARNTNLKAELIEAYKGMGSRDTELLKEWETASSEV